MSFTARTFSSGDTLTAANMNEIKSELSELYSKSKYIQSGLVPAFDCTGSSYTDVEVTFSSEFSSTPIVVATFNSASTNVGMGNVSILIASRTTTGFTIRVANNTSTTFKPSIFWVAVAAL